MSSYGKFYNFRYGIYCAINKNDDDLHIEIVELDWRLAYDNINKAADIINAKVAPPSIAENPSYFACKFCSKKGICWDNEPVEINCRSCKFAEAVENKEWKCIKFDAIIPQEFIKQGCPQHQSINQ